MERMADIPQRRGKNADPEFQRQRAQKMVAARLGVGVAVKRVVERADELTEEHRRLLASVLAGGVR